MVSGEMERGERGKVRGHICDSATAHSDSLSTALGQRRGTRKQRHATKTIETELIPQWKKKNMTKKTE
jgi:hypothetical protein